ncbi:hypothetical protein RYX36_001943, partial [Vicia faba]
WIESYLRYLDDSDNYNANISDLNSYILDDTNDSDLYEIENSNDTNDSDFTPIEYSNDTNNSKFTPIQYPDDPKDTSYTEKFKHLWVECESCFGLNYKKFFKSKMNICEHCGDHLKMSSSDRIELSIDPESTGLLEAVQTGTGQLNGIPVAIGIMDFQFLGGSMGSVVGEKITRLIEYATNQLLPLIIVCASGGARMQEGSLSLMQMAKISSALYNYQINQKLLYVAILTSPTTGGVTASFGMLGDIIIAEPKAYLAFAGKRVIEQTLNKEVPEGSQSAEVFFEKGLLDAIVSRDSLKDFLSELFEFHGCFPWIENEN